MGQVREQNKVKHLGLRNHCHWNWVWMERSKLLFGMNWRMKLCCWNAKVLSSFFFHYSTSHHHPFSCELQLLTLQGLTTIRISCTTWPITVHSEFIFIAQLYIFFLGRDFVKFYNRYSDQNIRQYLGPKIAQKNGSSYVMIFKSTRKAQKWKQ